MLRPWRRCSASGLTLRHAWTTPSGAALRWLRPWCAGLRPMAVRCNSVLPCVRCCCRASVPLALSLKAVSRSAPSMWSATLISGAPWSCCPSTVRCAGSVSASRPPTASPFCISTWALMPAALRICPSIRSGWVTGNAASRPNAMPPCSRSHRCWIRRWHHQVAMSCTPTPPPTSPGRAGARWSAVAPPTSSTNENAAASFGRCWSSGFPTSASAVMWSWRDHR